MAGESLGATMTVMAAGAPGVCSVLCRRARNTRKLTDVIVRDHPGRAQMRYDVNWASAEQLPMLMAEGRQHVQDAMLSAFIAEHW